MKWPLFQFVENKFLLITLGLVLGLAFPTFLSLADGGEELLAPQVLNGHQRSDLRQPASLAENTSVKFNPSEDRPLQAKYDLHCKKRALSDFRQSGEFIQLEGESCVKNFNFQQLEIVNKSNGYTATVFPTQSGKYQTDLIQLQPGANEIAIRYRDNEGRLAEEILNTFRE